MGLHRVKPDRSDLASTHAQIHIRLRDNFYIPNFNNWKMVVLFIMMRKNEEEAIGV